jgi:hypothetical protein
MTMKATGTRDKEMMMKASELAQGDEFIARGMCGPCHTYRRVADEPGDATGVIALDLDWGGRVRFPGGIEVELVAK